MNYPPRKAQIAGTNKAHRTTAPDTELFPRTPMLSEFAFRAIAREHGRGTPEAKILRTRFTTTNSQERRPTIGEVHRAIGAGR